MTLQPVTPDPKSTVVPSGGIYDLRIVGGPARSVRRFYDEMAPTEEDSAGVAFGKNVVRYGSVVAAGVGGAAVVAVLAL